MFIVVVTTAVFLVVAINTLFLILRSVPSDSEKERSWETWMMNAVVRSPANDTTIIKLPTFTKAQDEFSDVHHDDEKEEKEEDDDDDKKTYSLFRSAPNTNYSLGDIIKFYKGDPKQKYFSSGSYSTGRRLCSRFKNSKLCGKSCELVRNLKGSARRPGGAAILLLLLLLLRSFSESQIFDMFDRNPYEHGYYGSGGGVPPM